MRLPRRLVGLAATLAFAALGPSLARAESNARGAELYELCTQCHGAAGEGNQAALAPNIAGLPEWYVLAQLQNFRSGARGTHPEDVGGLRMYPMSQTLKTDDDMKAVAAFVAAMPKVHPEPTLTGGDPARGAQFYAICAQCHGPDAAGIGPDKAMPEQGRPAAPPLSGQADWYLLSSIQNFKAGMRGTYQNAVIMRGMVASLADEQAMKDVIAHIQSLSSGSAAK